MDVESNTEVLRLRHCPPYWHANKVPAKGRWLNREILELVSTEFRDRSVEYYKFALSTGATKINGLPAPPGTIVRNGDLIENMRHRHEPPITSIPVKIVHRDDENGFIVIDKPPSVPVHGVGRYFKHSLVQILKNDFGIKKPYTVNRLDRLTSGCMFIGTTAETARVLTDEIFNGTMQKVYIARCFGEFPAEEVIVKNPLISIDRQMGLNVVHPEGKPAETIFNRLFYDEKSLTSVVECRPITGRTHQIRVHLQYIGFPIVNDPIYSDVKIWGPELGKGGFTFPVPLNPIDDCHEDVATDQSGGLGGDNGGDNGGVPRSRRSDQFSTLREVDALPNDLLVSTTVEMESLNTADAKVEVELPMDMPSPSLYPTKLPRDPETLAATRAQIAERPKPPKKVRYGHYGLPGRRHPNPPKKSQNAASLISDQFNHMDSSALLPRETGDDIGMASPVPLTPEVVTLITRMRNRKDEKEEFSRWKDLVFLRQGVASLTAATLESNLGAGGALGGPSQLGLTTEAQALLQSVGDVPSPSSSEEPSFDYCKECFLPLWPDPKPSELFICLHALRYSTSKWSFETEMPFWAKEGWILEETA